MGFMRKRKERQADATQQTDTAESGRTVPNDSSGQQETEPGTNSESQLFMEMPDDELLQELQTKRSGKTKKYGAARKGRVKKIRRSKGTGKKKGAISLRKKKTQ